MKKEKKLNNKGFTLIEVLAVIVILVIIVSIAIPNISASLDRQSCTIMENRAELIESAAQFYVSDNRGTIKTKLGTGQKCKISTDQLKPEYITADDLKDNDGNTFSGYIIYDITNAATAGETYTFCINDLDGNTATTATDNCGINTNNSCPSDSVIESMISCN